MKGVIAWNGAAVVGCGVVFLLHEVYGAGSLVLAFASAALVFAVLMALDRAPEAVLFVRDLAGVVLMGFARGLVFATERVLWFGCRVFTVGLRMRADVRRGAHA